jgi:uncharacterized protein
MLRPLQDEGHPTRAGRSLPEKALQDCLAGELRVVNAGLPQRQKSLADLLDENYPHVICNDGSTHLFKRSELEYLAGMLDADEKRTLALPMIIELGSDQSEAAVLCRAKAEEIVVSGVLNMPVASEHGKIRLYRPQLAALRRKLRTTTAYLFSPRHVA